MATIQNIRQRAQQLAAKWQKLSISPAEVGLLIDDLAAYTNDAVINGSSLGIRRTYDSKSAMDADSISPVDQWGKPMKRGELVAITSTDADAGKIYMFADPGWVYITTVIGVKKIYETKLDLSGVSNGSTVSAEQANELAYIQEALDEGKTILSSTGVLTAIISYRRPSLIVNMSYIVGNELRLLTTTTPRGGGGTWTVKTQDLGNMSGGGISDVTDDSTTGLSYERIKGAWVARSYYSDGDLGKITSISDSDKLEAALGDWATFIKAVGDGARIFSTDFSASDGNYKTNTEIMYTKRDDLALLDLSWIINGVMTFITVDTSDGWGDILTFKQQSLTIGVSGNGKNSEVFNDYEKNTAYGQYSHIEGMSSDKAYAGSAIPGEQKVMLDWSMSSTGFAMSYGIGSHVEGQNCLATGTYAHAEGIKTLSANDGAHSEGSDTKSLGTYAHAEGQGTTAYAISCHTEGGLTLCNGNYGHAEGFRSTVENTAGHAEGYITYCRANYGHTEGRQTNAIGPCAHAEGYGNKIERSITITNISNKVGQLSSFTADNINDMTTGTGLVIDNIPYVVVKVDGDRVYLNNWIEFRMQKYDIIIMQGVAYGNNSHVEGEFCTAGGKNSHVSGTYCVAFNDSEVACGQYNLSNIGDDEADRSLHTIGIGTSSARKNAQETMANGDLYIFGIGGYDGANYKRAKTLQKVLKESASIKIWNTDLIIKELQRGEDINAGFYPIPCDNVLDVQKYVLVGIIGEGVDTYSTIPLSLYREADKLWVSFLTKDKYVRFSVEVDVSTNSWGNIRAVDYKETIIQ